MASPKVTATIEDLSTRVEEQTGIAAGIVIPALKGPVNVPTLVIRDTDFLEKFTPKSTIGVDFHLSHFSALSYLEQSNKLWVVRAAKEAKYGGIVVRSSSSSYDNYALTTGLDTLDSYVFDGNPDVPGVAEVTSVLVNSTASSLGGKSLLLQDEAGSVKVWFNFNAGNTEPAGAATRSVEVPLVTGDNTTELVAGKILTAFTGDSGLDATVDASTVTFTDKATGTRTDASDVDTLFTITTETQGVDEVDSVDEVILIGGSSQGAWVDDLLIKITNYATDPVLVKQPGAFLVQVYASTNLATPLESHVCSRDMGAKDGYGNNIFIENVLLSSKYIRAVNNSNVSSTTTPKDQSVALAFGGGDDGSAVTDAEMITASDKLKNKDSYPLTLLLDGGWATAPYATNLNLIAGQRGDCEAILTVPVSAETSATYLQDIVDYRNTILNLNTVDSALYSPGVKIYDKFNARDIIIPPDGQIGGVVAYCEREAEIWSAPAGFNRGVLNVSDTRIRFEESEMDVLYDNGINPIRYTSGRGIVVWGQKTLTSVPSSRDRLNVVFLIKKIVKEISPFLENYTFEFNDEPTRSSISAIVGDYMADVQSRRGTTAYEVVCNESNNSATDIDNYRLNVDLYLQPNKASEQIRLGIVITRTGVEFNTAA